MGKQNEENKAFNFENEMTILKQQQHRMLNNNLALINLQLKKAPRRKMFFFFLKTRKCLICLN